MRSKNALRAASYSDKTVVNAWADKCGGWWGAGTRSAYPSTGMNDPYLPNLTYQYKTDDTGKITEILVSYWRLGGDVPVTHNLVLESKNGLQL
ncbi:hypothetical protein GCM10023219_29210 [Stakelama sediminis]